MTDPKRYGFWGVIVHLPGGGCRPEVHFKLEEDGLFVAYQDYEKLKTEVDGLKAETERLFFLLNKSCLEKERLRKAGDAMARQYFDLYWSLHAESTSRHEPKSITDWEAAKNGKDAP